MAAFGLDRIDPEKDFRITLIEGADRILPALPERISKATEKLLTDLGVHVRAKAKVTEVRERRRRSWPMAASSRPNWWSGPPG